jgi:hypothetical protein
MRVKKFVGIADSSRRVITKVFLVRKKCSKDTLTIKMPWLTDPLGATPIQLKVFDTGTNRNLVHSYQVAKFFNIIDQDECPYRFEVQERGGGSLASTTPVLTSLIQPIANDKEIDVLNAAYPIRVTTNDNGTPADVSDDTIVTYTVGGAVVADLSGPLPDLRIKIWTNWYLENNPVADQQKYVNVDIVKGCTANSVAWGTDFKNDPLTINAFK